VNYPISTVIAAAGRGSRSGVPYPKCLHEVNGKVILASLMESLPDKSDQITIIASPSGRMEIEDFLIEFNLSARIVVQEEPRGMGNAILQLQKIDKSLQPEIFLAWGDLPFISKDTVTKLINFHFNNRNDFSFVTFFTDKAYTEVSRDTFGNIISVIETREIKDKSNKIKAGERDIGIFLFKKDLILKYLSLDLENSIGAVTQEHGFLYLIEHLVNDNFKVGSIETNNTQESISFNSLQDISNLE
jgi:bifunctional UDP-N-acetylglucosamine pyrophosphorylase/glucosamine-1-phosphate N-acetyltransferase